MPATSKRDGATLAEAAASCGDVQLLTGRLHMLAARQSCVTQPLRVAMTISESLSF